MLNLKLNLFNDYFDLCTNLLLPNTKKITRNVPKHKNFCFWLSCTVDTCCGQIDANADDTWSIRIDESNSSISTLDKALLKKKIVWTIININDGEERITSDIFRLSVTTLNRVDYVPYWFPRNMYIIPRSSLCTWV